MASTIQIKRGTGSAVPSGLADGELAINLDNGKLYFGSGSTSVNNFTFGELTAEKYIVSSSVLYVTTSFSSGSTEFGNSADDTHTFTGNVTASGNVSASGTIESNGFISTATYHAGVTRVIYNLGDTVFLGDTAVSQKVSIQGADVTLNPDNGIANVEGSSTTGFKVFSTHAGTNRYVGLTLSASSNGQQYTLGLNRANDSFVIAPSDVSNAHNNAVFELDTTGNITASGDISSSGTIIGSNLSGTNTGDQDLSSYSTITQLNASSSTLQTNIDGKQPTLTFGKSSGNALRSEEALTTNDILLVGSSHIKGRTYTELKGDLGLSTSDNVLFNNITASGNISASGTINGLNLSGINTGDQNISNLAITGSDVIFANITSSGNISASGGVIGNTFLTNGYNTANSTGTTLRLGYDSGLTVLSYGKDSDTSHFFYGTAITASGHISASGTIFTDEISSPSNNLIVSSSTVTITSTTDNEANLILESDTDNDDENDNPFMSFKQDGGGIAGMIGLSGDADKWPDGTTLTGVTENAMVIGMYGVATSTNREIFLAAGGTASLEIKNNADVHIMNGDLHLDNANALFGGTHLLIKYDGEVKIGAGNRGLELNSTTTEVNGLTTFTSAITASGEISSSGNILTDGEVQTTKFRSHDSLGVLELEGDAGSGLRIHTTHATGNRIVGLEMSASGTGQVFSMALNRSNESFVISPTKLAGSGTSVFELDATGNITSSGNISSSGIVSADRFIGKQLAMMPFTYLVTSNHSSELYIPIGNTQIESTVDQWYGLIFAPYDGEVKRISIGWQNDDPGDTTIRVRKAAGSDPTPDQSGDIVQTMTSSSLEDDYIYVFEGFSASFSKGEAVAITVEAASGNATSYVSGMIAIEYDTNS